MDNKLIEKYLMEFAEIAEKWIRDRDWLLRLHNSFKEFFKKENLEKADWQYFQKLRTDKLIHSFNALPLAGKRALGEENHEIQHYRDVFLYLKYGKENDNVRFNNLVDKNGEYSLAFFGKSAMSELIGQAFPEKYVFYNARDIEAIKFLGFEIDEKNKNFGDIYIEYNDLIKKNIKPKFEKYIKTTLDNKIPIGLRIDQFFSWLYEEHIFKNIKNNFNADVRSPKGKIIKIKILSFNQFKEFELNLIYPKGHPREGRPLEKICFIGQSGTGKTTLLDIIKELTSLKTSKIQDIDNKTVEIYYRLSDKAEERIIEYKVSLSKGKIDSQIIKADSKKDKKINEIETQIGATAFPTLMYFPPDIISQINLIDKEIDDKPPQNNDYSFKEEIIDFSLQENNEIIKNIWNNLLLRIQQYRNEQNIQKLKFANAVLSNSEEKKEDALKQYQNWKSKNPNPIKDLGEKYLNNFLQRFNLKMNYESETNKIFRFEPLFDTTEVLLESLSTGTKQILLRTLPFYSLWDKENENGLPRNSIILMDEPENSLYPDIQRIIIEYFQSLTENCQFFFATHSPIIASSFEPCERFILSFNESGNVICKKGIAPEGTSSNEILKSEYQTPVLGEKGEEKWNRFLELLDEISQASDNEKKTLLMNEYMKIGNDYNFTKV